MPGALISPQLHPAKSFLGCSMHLWAFKALKAKHVAAHACKWNWRHTHQNWKCVSFLYGTIMFLDALASLQFAGYPSQSVRNPIFTFQYFLTARLSCVPCVSPVSHVSSASSCTRMRRFWQICWNWPKRKGSRQSWKMSNLLHGPISTNQILPREKRVNRDIFGTSKIQNRTYGVSCDE